MARKKSFVLIKPFTHFRSKLFWVKNFQYFPVVIFNNTNQQQEMWIQEYLPKVNVKVCQAIGGTLDAITGETKRAPTLFQKLPLEWLYRLIIDPKRIRRQAIIPYFLFKVFTQKRGSYPS